MRERILTIRLMEKVKKAPAYAETFGIILRKDATDLRMQSESEDNLS